MRKMGNQKIDIVVTWVDYNDPIWQKEYLKFVSSDQKKSRFVGDKARYEAQDTFKYFFRGIEKYASWVNKIYFVTYGHIPAWLNESNPKLVVVKHSDFIPKEYLPTFNSNTILLNIHRIKDLSENFILFNDDMYIINKCSPNIFFKKGLPRDCGVINPIVAPDLDPFWDMMVNNLFVINSNFSKKKCFKNHPFKWINLKYGLKNNIRNISSLFYNKFSGFYDYHLPNPHLKSVFEEVWSKNYEICNSTCLNKFRTSNDITEWTMKYWQLASNKFLPIRKQKIGEYVSLKDNSYKKIIYKNNKYKLVCFNDSKDDMTDLNEYFMNKFPDKSEYEK